MYFSFVNREEDARHIGLSQARLSRELFQSFNGADIRSIRHYDPANDGEFIEES